MYIKKLNRKGFSHIEMAIVVLVVAALGFVGYRVLSNTSHAGTNCKGTNYSQGSSGQCVKDIQTIVGALDNVSVTVDGSFGPMTAQAVKNFQLSRGGAQDGIVGPATWSLLCSLPLQKATSAEDAAHVNACGDKFPVGPNIVNVSSATDKLWSLFNGTVLPMGANGIVEGSSSSKLSQDFTIRACYHEQSTGKYLIIVSAKYDDSLNTNGDWQNPLNLNIYWRKGNDGTWSTQNYSSDWYSNVAVVDMEADAGPASSIQFHAQIKDDSARAVDNTNTLTISDIVQCNFHPNLMENNKYGVNFTTGVGFKGGNGGHSQNHYEN